MIYIQTLIRMSVSTIASLVLANTTTNAGTITLPPANQIAGRVITFKDSGGNFVNKALTLACSGADTFEDGTTTKTLRETYGTIQVAAISPKWFIISGTQVNTLAASTIKTAALSTTSISSATATLSSLGLVNQQGSTVSMYQASTFLYFNNFIVAGARVGVGQLFYPLTIPSIIATGSYTTSTYGGKLFYIFTDSGTITISRSTNFDYFALGGGAGGGANNAGGGGAGGLIMATRAIIQAGTYSISIGLGGTSGTFTAAAGSGGNTSFGSSVIAVGGGGGGFGNGTAGITGGCGGGGAGNAGSAAATPGSGTQGYSGGSGNPSTSGGGGGGGVGGVGGSANPNGNIGGNGGIGILYNGIQYGGGGGAGTYSGTPGTGSYRGGNGAGNNQPGTSAEVNSGSGGGGGGGGGSGLAIGGVGGSGIFIISIST